jgi:hypothetical protein
MLSKRQPEMAGAAWQVYAARQCLVLAYDHAQIAGYELPVISAVDEYGPAGRFIQSVQQPEGRLSRSSRAYDGKRLAPRTLKVAPARRIFTGTQRPRSLVRTALHNLRNYRYEIGFLILVRTTSR